VGTGSGSIGGAAGDRHGRRQAPPVPDPEMRPDHGGAAVPWAGARAYHAEQAARVPRY
jgi:hypothetical protein